MLLRFSGVGKVSWKNYLCGILLPWGYVIGRGGLLPIVLTSWIVWVLLGMATAVLLGASGGAGATIASPSAGTPTYVAALLFVVWGVCGAAILYLLGAAANTAGFANRQARVFVSMMLILLSMITASAALRVNDCPLTALLVGGGPLVLVGAPFLLAIVAFMIFGRKIR